MLIRAARRLSNLTVAVIAILAAAGATTTAQPKTADLLGILHAVVAIREGQGRLVGETAVWHLTAGDVAGIELARVADIRYRLVNSGGGQTPCPWNPTSRGSGHVAGYDATVDVQSDGPDAARVKVALSCANAPNSTHRTYYFGRYYSVVRVGNRWTARLEGFEITMPRRPLPNFALERTLDGQEE